MSTLRVLRSGLRCGFDGPLPCCELDADVIGYRILDLGSIGLLATRNMRDAGYSDSMFRYSIAPVCRAEVSRSIWSPLKRH
jgi:hypothetical protein